jgi:crotonobetaine/carnitine-CoA ligase
MTPEATFAHLVGEGDMVLDKFDACVARLPEKTFLHYGEDGVSLSFAEVRRRTDRLAAGLIACGVAPGDRVCVYTRNALISALSMLAIWRAGAVFAPINFYYRDKLLAYQVNDTAPAAIITDVASAPLFEAVTDAIGPRHFILHRPRAGEHDHDPAAASLVALRGQRLTDLADIMATPADAPSVPRGYADVANIIYTSGTTGPAKGVVQPYRWINQYTFCLRQLMGEDDVIYCDLPLYHVGGAFFDLARALWRGNTVALWDRFSPTQFWNRVCGVGATSAILVDVMTPWLMNAPPAPTDRANTLRHVHMQPFPPNHHAVAERFGIDFVTIGFGQTEAGLGFCGLIDELPTGGGTPAALYRGLSRDETRAAAARFGIMTVGGDADLPKGFMGAPSPLLEPAILDEEDNRCPPGQVGQLAFRPRFPSLILQEYFGKPEATRRAFANCWFHTGDAARVDADGGFRFVDRMGGFFRVRGENVSSFQVEDLINAHPDVRACAAIGVPAHEGGEDDIAVFVELREGAGTTEAELMAHATKVMPRFMLPRYLRIIDALPLTPTNKVEKYKLKQSLLAETAASDR